MDANFRIYQAPEEQIPAEDKARLDGYLRARAEAAESDGLRAELARIKEYLAKKEDGSS